MKKTTVSRILRGVEIGCLLILAAGTVADMLGTARCMRCSCDDGCLGCGCGEYDGDLCRMACNGTDDQNGNDA